MAYTDEVNAQVIVALLKRHGIRKVIASPGATNVSLVASMEQDPHFEMFSAVDERSAAYMACGLAAESGEPVVLSCTGATASRNYMPGMTEAFYRKLPVLAITSAQIFGKIGHHVAQVIDRSTVPKDVAKLSVALPVVVGDDDLWECEIKVNQAILELKRHGGGPVHINLPTTYSQSFDAASLPNFRYIDRFTGYQELPSMPTGRIAIFVGAHAPMSVALTAAIDKFCAAYDAVVFCDHTSGYHGKFRVQYSLAGFQQSLDLTGTRADLLIHLGEVSGDYYSLNLSRDKVWRVSEDGEIRDTFRKLQYVFEMTEMAFFEYFGKQGAVAENGYLAACQRQLALLRAKIPELPFSNILLASKFAPKLPDGAVVHFGILNSLRSWNFFELPANVSSSCNVGAFGIDGCVSSLLGASLANQNKLYFGVVGDLAFFYDMNAVGSRHVGKNLRLIVVNNGMGVEFKNYNHRAAKIGHDPDAYIAAAGHFGNKSRALICHYAQDLGFEYLSASSSDELDKVADRFLSPGINQHAMLLEVFTDGDDESRALEMMSNLEQNTKGMAKQLAKSVLGEGGINTLKKLFGK
jgi:2-succinyl-5-enolpyruvyl-6-hydroxy-3-cyclohexene-1-carboxylate synthase